MAELTEQAKGVVEAFNNDDWDAARGLLGDSTYNELGTQRSLAGADAIIGALQGWKAAMPDVRGTVTSTTESGQRVVLEVTWEGTQTGEMVTEQGTIPPSGKRPLSAALVTVPFTSGIAVFQPCSAPMIASAPASERCVPSSLYVESPKSPFAASQSSLLNASTMLLAFAVNSAMVCLHLFGGPHECPSSRAVARLATAPPSGDLTSMTFA
jgi:predicted ester cyclase